MNRIAKRLAMAGLLVMFACSSSSTGPVLLTVPFSLQGVIANAITGARIGGDIKLFLIQGATIRGPSRLITATGDPLQGEYAFVGIPVEFNTGNNVWKVVAIATGYQRFESEITFTVQATGSTIIDTTYNRIGNIFLFPIGTPTPDYTITATYNGKPVPGATVQLDPFVPNNTSVFSAGGGSSIGAGGAFNDVLPATDGYVQSLQVVTDANGKALFAGTTLALGAAYFISVLPVAYKEPITGSTIPLRLTFGPQIFAGFQPNDIRVTLFAVPPGTGTGVPLYLAGASNRATGQLSANGQLVITFSIPVTVVNLAGFNAALNPGTNAAGTAAGAGVLSATQPVNATLSPDGLTLTLAPNYASAAQTPAATDRGVGIVYLNGPPGGAPAGVGPGEIVAKDYPATAFKLFGGAPVALGQLAFSDGTTDNGAVAITGP